MLQLWIATDVGTLLGGFDMSMHGPAALAYVIRKSSHADLPTPLFPFLLLSNFNIRLLSDCHCHLPYRIVDSVKPVSR